jgi:intraflagellar transport protein 81
LNYKSPVSGEALLNGISIGDHSVVYPALYWLLQNLPLLKKRAYLARFLVNVAVPEDLFADEAVTESFEQYRQCREEFKELHKQ